MSILTAQIEDLTKQFAELQNLVKDNMGESTLDMDKIVAEAEKIIEERAKAIAAEAIDNAPARRIPGNSIGNEFSDQVQKSNRYYKTLRDIDAHGRSKQFGQNIKAVDLWLAHQMLLCQKSQWSARMGGNEPVDPSDDMKAAIKALTSTGSGTGDELVPTILSSDLWDDFFLASRIVNAMVQMPMPSNPFEVPLGLGDVTWRKGTENAATTASDPATAKSILTATELVTEQNWSYTLDEDAIVALAPTLRQRLAISGGEIMDDFALNADSTNAATGNINLDDADPADDSYYLSEGQDGIRHQWLIDNAAQNINAGGDALTDADIVSMLTAMGKYAVNPDQTVMACDVSTYFKGFLSLDGTLTVDKFGPEAVIRTGQLASYRGVPIIPSASHRLTEADGKLSTTGGNNTLGSISCFNVNMWYAGFIRDLLIEFDRDIQKRQFIMVTSLREAVAAHGTRSSNTHTAGIRNILVA